VESVNNKQPNRAKTAFWWCEESCGGVWFSVDSLWVEKMRLDLKTNGSVDFVHKPSFFTQVLHLSIQSLLKLGYVLANCRLVAELFLYFIYRVNCSGVVFPAQLMSNFWKAEVQLTP